MALVYKRTITAYEPDDVHKLKIRLGGNPQKALTLTAEALENSDLKRCSAEQYASSLEDIRHPEVTQIKFSWVEHTYLTAGEYEFINWWPGGFGSSTCFFDEVLREQARVRDSLPHHEGFEAVIRNSNWAKYKIVDSKKLQIKTASYICPFVMKYEVAEVDDSRLKWKLDTHHMNYVSGFYMNDVHGRSPDITMNLLCAGEDKPREIPLYNRCVHMFCKAICVDFEGLEFKTDSDRPMEIGYFSRNSVGGYDDLLELARQ